LKHEPYRRHLLAEIHRGIKLGIVGTPSYLVDGDIYESSIPAEILIPVIDGKNYSKSRRAALQ
jgi:hypothetical protein